MEDDYDKARVLQKQYAFVFAEAVPQMNLDTFKTPSQLNNIGFSVPMIEKQLRIINAQSAPGPNKIHSRVLKHLASILAAALENIFTKSMETGRLPPAWKSALVKPMFKVGDRHDPANYRPVSLTLVVGKVMERLVKNESHFQKEGLWAIAQHGFQKDMLCVTNFLVAGEEWVRIADSGHRLDVIFVDFSKAFGHVPHEYLLSNLLAHGITGSVRLVKRFSGWKVNDCSCERSFVRDCNVLE